MFESATTRGHPIAAYRAVRALMRNREDTRQVFLLIDALRGKTTLRQLARFRATEFGRAALADHRRLFDRLEDRETLKALPAGTLGGAYYEFMASENLSAEGLVKASTIPQSSDDSIWFRERNRGRACDGCGGGAHRSFLAHRARYRRQCRGSDLLRRRQHGSGKLLQNRGRSRRFIAHRSGRTGVGRQNDCRRSENGCP